MPKRIHYVIDLTAEQWAALVRHGYDPLLPRRGVGGGPGRVQGSLVDIIDGQPVYLQLRNWVCYLDGVEIDGHEVYDGGCVHCTYDSEDDDGAQL